MNIIGVLFIIISINGELDHITYIKPLESMQECEAWKRQQEFVPTLPKQLNEVARGYWCEEVNKDEV